MDGIVMVRLTEGPHARAWHDAPLPHCASPARRSEASVVGEQISAHCKRARRGAAVSGCGQRAGSGSEGLPPQRHCGVQLWCGLVGWGASQARPAPDLLVGARARLERALRGRGDARRHVRGARRRRAVGGAEGAGHAGDLHGHLVGHAALGRVAVVRLRGRRAQRGAGVGARREGGDEEELEGWRHVSLGSGPDHAGTTTRPGVVRVASPEGVTVLQGGNSG